MVAWVVAEPNVTANRSVINAALWKIFFTKNLPNNSRTGFNDVIFFNLAIANGYGIWKVTLVCYELITGIAMSGDDHTKPRQKTEEMISKLLMERQEMLVRFCRVAGLDPFSPDIPSREALEEFCQVLVDYTAFGHFEIYSRILNGEERRKKVLEVASKIYPKIAEATDFAVAFNDKYDALTHTEPLDNLNDDLCKLGEEIAMRIDVEDQLVEALLAA